MTADICKVALVTEAASPLGQAVALALARHGWDIAVHYQSDAGEALATVHAIETIGRHAAAVHCDLTCEAEVSELLSNASRKLGNAVISCLINNASFMADDVAGDFSFAALDTHMHANLVSPVLLAQALYDAIPAGAQAVVVNLLDQRIFKPDTRLISYTLSNSALHTATVILAQALAPKVRVIGVAAGIMQWRNQSSRAVESTETPDRQQRAHEGSSMPPELPLTAEEIAATVCFAVESPAITGTTLLVDGGQTLNPYSAM